MLAKNLYKVYIAVILNKDSFIMSEMFEKDKELVSSMGVDLLRN